MSKKPAKNLQAFPTTSWERIRNAAQDRDSLGGLLERYLPPLRTYLILTKQLDPQEVDDVLQSFVADKVLRRNLLATASPDRGRFRTFLLAALDHYLIDRQRARRTRNARARRISHLDDAPGHEPSAPAPQVDVFDVSWAQEVLCRSLTQMRAECQRRQRSDLWVLFERRLLAKARGEAAESFASLAARLGFGRAKRAANAFQTALNMYRRILGHVLDAYAGWDTLEEMRGDLNAILAAVGPQLQDLLQDALRSSLPEISTDGSAPRIHDWTRFLQLVQAPPKPSIDLAEQLRRSLTSPLILDVADLSPRVAHQLCACTGQLEGRTGSLNDLLHHAKPSLELLRWVKEATKANRNNPDSPLPREVATVLHFATIAVALCRYGEWLTRSPDRVLRRGFQWVLKRTWVDERTKSLFRAGLEHVAEVRGG